MLFWETELIDIFRILVLLLHRHGSGLTVHTFIVLKLLFTSSVGVGVFQQSYTVSQYINQVLVNTAFTMPYIVCWTILSSYEA